MDRAAFDAFTRRLATTGSRRAVLGALGSAPVRSAIRTLHSTVRRIAGDAASTLGIALRPDVRPGS